MTRRRIKYGKRGVAASVAAILAAVFAVEGGFVDNPDDPGGATRWGITEETARAHGYEGNMVQLSASEAERIYKESYIDRPGFLPVVNASYALGHEIVDTGVNAGTSRASLWFQESLNHFNEKGRAYPDITEDGRIGPATMAAWEGLKRRRGERLACELMLKAMDAKQAQHYMRLAARSSRFETFMVGWFRTRIQNVPLSECAK